MKNRINILITVSVLFASTLGAQTPPAGKAVTLSDTSFSFVTDSFNHNLGKVRWIDTTITKYFRYIGTDTAIIVQTFTSDPYFICEWPKDKLIPGEVYSFKVCFNFTGKTASFNKAMGFQLANGEKITYTFSGTVIPKGWVDPKDDKFKKTAESVINAFTKGDSATLNKFIKPGVGIYYIGRLGVFDRIEHGFTIEHGYGGSETYDGFIGIKHKPLVYSSLPDYECGPEAWTKQGTFADSTQSDSLLTSTAKWQNKYGDQKYSKVKISEFRNLEQNSRKVVVTVVTGRSLVFSLTYIEGEWWLTIMDFVSDDCSA
jgi:hypothetical protein